MNYESDRNVHLLCITHVYSPSTDVYASRHDWMNPFNMFKWMNHNITNKFDVNSQNTRFLYWICIHIHVHLHVPSKIVFKLLKWNKHNRKKIYKRMKQILIPIVSVGCIAGSTVGSKVAMSFRSEITGECFLFIIYSASSILKEEHTCTWRSLTRGKTTL